ncbi:TetR family transcriptional regulator [Subtercola boreus]|uniref:acyl-CoA-like ligand-binding transcription factor n=1 Tax=Subtercola boreus TaxID=120213 RepID=UPI001174B2E8|nr:TetR family transcriptional regulator [Subtercola boreus]TQL54223.1 TetR family transcriptional regulator [Subtercola boreus]
MEEKSAATVRPPRGRPRSSSRELLEDAAYELFLENSYVKTTVEQITQRAGVGRSTFFNYFDGKSDVFWGDIDRAFGTLQARLDEQTPDALPLPALSNALAAVAREFGPSRVPWILTQYTSIGSVPEVEASALARFARCAGQLSTFVAVRQGLDPDTLLPRTVAYAATGAVVAAAQEWAAAGPSRGSLEPFVVRALDALARGFAA